MADIVSTPGGIPGQTTRRYHDEGDGTFSEANAAHLFYWTGSVWAKWDGTIQTGDIEIGAVELKDATTANRGVIDSSGAVSTNQTKVSGTAVSVNNGTVDAGTQRVTIASDSTGTVNTELPAAAALGDTDGNPTAPAVGAFGMLWNGSSWTRAAGNTLGQFVQGNVANAATDSGNPVKVGAKYNSAVPTYTDGQRGDLQLGSRGDLQVGPAAVVTLGDTAGGLGTAFGTITDRTNANSRPLAALGYHFNGTSTDRNRGNYFVATGDTGAKATSTFTGATQTNYDAVGAYIVCLLGTVTGAVTTFQTFLQWSFDGGTTWVGLTPLGANDTAAATGRTYAWMIYPTNTSQTAGTTPATLVPNGGPTQLNIVNAALPRTWRFCAVINVATSIAITSVNANYIRG